jgi:hypothetical protein
MDYYATPEGGVWIKKTGVIGRLSDFHMGFEQQATGHPRDRDGAAIKKGPSPMRP